jgi:peptidoglycan-associated lipoprotein
MNRNISWSRVLLVASVGAAVGCGSANTQSPPVAETLSVVSTTHTTSAITPAAPGNVVASPTLRERCLLNVDNQSTAPKFDFDEAQIVGQDATTLDQVARCLTTGPLKGASLSLVGRADPRGEQEYNMVLGSSRASSVAAYLTADGVASSQLTSTSRGKLDATGTDEEGWALDRRVDLDLR